VSAANVQLESKRGTRRELRADALGAGVVILLAVTVVQRAIGFSRGVMFCRWLSPESLGEWEMAYSFLMLASPLAVLGVPGSFGRYAEHYRQRGHLRTFLRRAAAWTAVCTAAALVLVEIGSTPLSNVVFGSSEYGGVMRTVGVCLVAVIFYHTLSSVLTALRLYRLVSIMQFAQSMMFAGLSLALLCRRAEMLSVLYGFSIACLLAAAGGLAWTWPALRVLDNSKERLPHGDFWSRLLRFAFFVWATNLLTQVFAMIDRYMLVHYSNLSPAEALDQVGHYHASRIVPLLMVSLAELLTGMIMPQVSHEWEAGRRREVSTRLNLAIKLTLVGMFAFGTCVLAAGPLLFNVILQGRYQLGLAVLPWAVAGCVWYGLYLIAQNYLWCAEKNWLQTVPLVLGLAANVAFNLLLLPAYGLYGCAMAAAAGAAVCLFSVLLLNRRHGMAVDAGVWRVALAPLALGLGVWPAIIGCGLIAIVSLRSQVIFNAAERAELKAFVGELLAKVRPFLRRKPAVGNQVV
jgi:O-antigen/teichoic acid export membrane protein